MYADTITEKDIKRHEDAVSRAKAEFLAHFAKRPPSRHDKESNAAWTQWIKEGKRLGNKMTDAFIALARAHAAYEAGKPTQ